MAHAAAAPSLQCTFMWVIIGYIYVCIYVGDYCMCIRVREYVCMCFCIPVCVLCVFCVCFVCVCVCAFDTLAFDTGKMSVFAKCDGLKHTLAVNLILTMPISMQRNRHAINHDANCVNLDCCFG